MKVSRLDLDGSGSPQGLVQKILAIEVDLSIPVQIEDLAYQLDIDEISELKTEGFEGGLITDEVRSFGGILVRKGMDRRRRRFTIGHELGHFLIPFHRPAAMGQFLCSRADMHRWSACAENRAARMEVEANTFSALMLMPPSYLKPFLGRTGDPSLDKLLATHEKFDVSKEAAARAYAQYHDERVCIVIAKDGAIARIYRGPLFPRLIVRPGQNLPTGSGYRSNATKPAGALTPLRSVASEDWIETAWGDPPPELSEQVLLQKNGFSMTLLWAEVTEIDPNEDPDEDRTSMQRYRDRTSRRL